jgi:transposase InsO family protein
MSRNTAAKYLATDKLPSELRGPRTWRTREDPFEEVWPGIAAKLKEQPGLEAKTLFQELQAEQPGLFQEGQVRTLQRRLKRWRAQEGPDRELFLPQLHRPGEAMQTDFTWMNTLGITIGGEPFAHMVCHCVLPYSNWSWATLCRSESMAAIKKGVQAALVRLGRVPEYHQTDNSTAATHRLDSKRDFNEDYLKFMGHYQMKARTIAVGCKEQNGDVESLNGALKRFVDQQLMLRGNRDFASQEGYVAWLQGILDKRNRTRGARFDEDLAAMRVLAVEPVPEFTEVTVSVGIGGTIRLNRNTYSVPSRLRDEKVRVRMFDDRIDVYHGDRLQLTMERLCGTQGHLINYRHVVHSLLRKPGGFRRYRYREDLFPTQVFRAAFEALEAKLPEREADIEYLRILHLAATTMEADVEVALGQLMRDMQMPLAESVRAIVVPRQTSPPELEAMPIDLTCYDSLLVERCLEVSA